jgi:phage terminase large subunit-like protein
MSEEQIEGLQYDWNFWGRPKQLDPPPGTNPEWSIWLNLAGRGYGKTRVGSERVKRWVLESWHSPIRIAGIAETKADSRDVLVEGDSGILSVFPEETRPKYEPSKRRLTWKNGTQMFLFSGEEPDQLRGPQFHKAWVDELAKYKYPQEAWDMLEFGLRLGENPQIIVTTTPRPIPIIIQLLKDPDCVVTTGSSYENYGNLAPRYIKRVISRFEGTRLGRQELHAEVLDDAPGAYWTRSILEDSRRKRMPELKTIVVSIDPAVTSTEESDETGIVVAGLGIDGHGYIFKDSSGIFSPRIWASRSITLHDKYEADLIIAEVNNGGDLVEATLRTVDRSRTVKFKKVRASRGKHIRAAPIASLFEQDRCHIVGSMPEMEDQLVSFTPEGYIGGGSPDRAEAMIWAIYYLMVAKRSRDYDPDDFPTYKR